MVEIWPSVVSALSTLDTWPETLLPRSTEIALPAGAVPATEPATRVAALSVANSCATASSTWLAGSFAPSAGALPGATITASVARFVGAPLSVR